MDTIESKLAGDRKLSGLRLPGIWIKHENRDWAFKASLLLSAIISQLDDVALALGLFEDVKIDLTKIQARDDETNFRRRLRHLYADAFVYALDAASQIISVLSKMPDTSDQTISKCKNFNAHFGYIRDIRNSLQHIEDRLLGYGPGKKPIPANLLVVGGSFKNGKYGVTITDGTYAEIEISRNILKTACRMVEDILWSFDWIGPGGQPVQRVAKTNAR